MIPQEIWTVKLYYGTRTQQDSQELPKAEAESEKRDRTSMYDTSSAASR